MTKRTKPTTWLAYIQALNYHGYDDMDELLNLHTAQFLNTQSIYPAFSHSVPAMYILDYTSGQYLIFSTQSKDIMGLDHRDFIEGGVTFMLHQYHPDHLRLFNEKIFQTRLEFLNAIPPEHHKDYIFTYNHRFKDQRGNFSDYLQRNCFIKSDSKGNPLVSFGMIINHNHFSPATSVVHIVEKMVQTEQGSYASLQDKKTFLINVEDEELFSRREKEILFWITEGLTSKEIADKLHVSEHTIVNHRRNMHEKSNTLNATALVSFALRRGIIH